MNMIKLRSERLVLRNLEPDDLTFFMAVENDASLWNICDTRVPFSRFTLERILEADVPDIFSRNQLRLVICKKRSGKAIGFVDFFDFSPLHRRVGMGIVVYPEKYRGRGYAEEAVHLALEYAFPAFNLHQVWADVPAKNIPSNKLFSALGFDMCGVRPQWLCLGGKFEDVNVYHLTIDNFKKQIVKTADKQ
jgi:acetyltransferase, GNAT family